MITLQIDHERFKDEPIVITMYPSRFTIGSHSHCDVKIVTFKNDTYLEIIQSSGGIFFKSLGDYSFMHNGKKYKGQRKCEIGDEFIVDRSVIKIINIDTNNINEPIDFTNNQLKDGYETLFKAIQKELIYSDKEF